MSTFNRLTDRCDKCNAQAFVRTSNDAGQDLLWCAHHYSKYEFGLAESGFFLSDDERDKVNQKPSVSANAD